MGINKKMNLFVTDIADRLNMRTFGSIAPDNIASLKSAQAVNEVDIIVAPSSNVGGVKVMLPLLVPLPEILKLENEPFEVKVAISYPPVLLSYRPSSSTVFNKYFDDLLTIT